MIWFSYHFLFLLINRNLFGGRDHFSESRELFPGSCQVKFAELLGQFDRLLDHSTELIIIAALKISRKREILSQRMAFKPVICEDATKVRVVCEIDAVHVPHLPLVPVGGLEDFVDRLNGRELISIGFDADTGVEAEGQQVVDNLKSERSSWDVNPTDIRHGAKLGVVVILEEAHHRNNSLRSNQNLKLVPRGELGLLDILGQALRHILPKLGEIFSDFGIKLPNSWPGL